jgi:class 3 adenylate cyclase/tetratricopeptide (TPR) repeat protein/anti-anti-sigma regulatory factor
MNRPTPPTLATSAGERKQITAVFIDVVGFSDIASTADAEDLEVWLEGFYASAKDIVMAHDGEITEYLGDGVVALFGLERADELAAVKAVRAAMQAVETITTGLKGLSDMQLRAGVATGEAAVRASAGPDNRPRATGMVTTLAKRVQEHASPGTVMIAQSTRQLLRDLFAFDENPAQTLKGFAEPQTLYRPLPLTGPATRQAPPFFVGRTAERARIDASTVPCLLVGPAGIGKTALTRVIGASVADQVVLAADGAQTRASYQPFIDWIMRETGTALPEFRDLSRHFPTLEDEAHNAIALVLGLPEGQRLLVDRSSLALKSLIENSLWQAIRARHPQALLVFEDLHWMDNASFGVLVAILQSAQAAQHRILMTSREDTKIGRYLAPLDITMIPLDPLDDTDASQMIDAMAQTALDAADRKVLLDQAAGVPLFIQQLFKLHGAGTNALPGTLMDLLAEQIDATGASKPVLQCAAVIGRGFSVDMLRAIADEHEPLSTHLDKACASGVLVQNGGADYSFAHALLHQAAYQGLLRRTRIDYHSRIAAHLQDHHADAVRRNPALLTDHLSLAQQHVPAIQNYLTVSQWALFQGAFEDAEAHILAAIALCGEAPADVDVTDLKIACYTALGSIRVQMQGFMSAPVKEAFEQVAKLASTRQDQSTANGPAFYGSFSHAVISADKSGADRFARLLRETADSVTDDAAHTELQLASLNVQTSLHFYSGNFPAQFPEFEKLRALYDITRHGAMIASYGADPFAAAQMFETAGRAIYGDSHMIPALCAEIDAHQDLLNIPVMRPYAQVWGAVPMFYAGLVDQAILRVKAGIATAQSQSAAFWQATGAAWLNVMDPTQSATQEGLAGFDTVIKTHEMIGANIGLPYFRAHYAHALLRQGQTDAAIAESTRALRENAANGLFCWYPEVMRLHAQMCLATGRQAEAVSHLEKSARQACAQDARLWLLRTQLDQHAIGTATPDDLRATLARFDPAAEPPEVQRARSILSGK